MTWFLRATTASFPLPCTRRVLHELRMSQADVCLLTQPRCQFIKAEPGAATPLLPCSSLHQVALIAVLQPPGGLLCPCTWYRRQTRGLPLQQGPWYLCQELSFSKTSLSLRRIPTQPCVVGRNPCQFSWHLPAASHLAFKWHRDVL